MEEIKTSKFNEYLDELENARITGIENLKKKSYYLDDSASLLEVMDGIYFIDRSQNDWEDEVLSNTARKLMESCFVSENEIDNKELIKALIEAYDVENDGSRIFYTDDEINDIYERLINL